MSVGINVILLESWIWKRFTAVLAVLDCHGKCHGQA